MLRGRPVGAAFAVAVLIGLSLPALAQVDGESETPGVACPPGSVAGQANKPNWDTFFECNGSGNWQRGPYFFGATSDTCDSNHAGMVQWTGGSISPNNTFEFCNGTSWIIVNGAASSVPLSGITAATGSASIDSGSNAITWNWNSLTTGTALTLSSTSMTTGSLLSLQNSNIAATSTGAVLSISDATTGTGYGVYSIMNGHGNSGYAGYFTNTSTGSSGQDYGIYVINTSSGNLSAAVYGSETGPGSTMYGVYGTASGNGSIGVGGLASGGSSSIGGWFRTASSGTGYGVYGNVNNTSNTGYAGFFLNADTSNASYGVYGTDGSASGYGGYFTNTSTGWALGATGTSYFNGNVGIGQTTPATKLDVNGDITNENVKSCAMLGTDSNGKLVCQTPAMVLISTQTASASASLQFSGANWSSSYTTLFLNCAGILSSSTANNILVRVGEGAGPTWETGAHYDRIDNAGGSKTAIDLTGYNGGSNDTTHPTTYKLYIDNVGSATLYKNVTMMLGTYNGGILTMTSGTGFWSLDTNPVTGIELVADAGNIASGTCSLYGMN